MTQSQTIFRKITDLERKLQRLKIQAYFNLPRGRRSSVYPEEVINKALRATRQAIWQERYAKSIKGVS